MRRALLISALALLSADVAHSQGLVSATTNAPVPNSSSAATDDGFALGANPAGLAFVETLQLTGGYIGRFGAAPSDHVGAAGALQLVDGWTLGAGTELVLHPLNVRSPYLHGTLSSASRIDRFLALGVTGHALADTLPGGNARFLMDLGMQLRPASFLAFGASIDGIGAAAPDVTSARAGVAVRPIGEWLTVGADARWRPGNANALSQTFWTTSTVDTAATARLHIGGFALTASAGARDVLRTGGPELVVTGGLQVDTSHLGALLLGGYESDGSFTAGALGRVSAERFSSVLPPGGSWIALSLVGDGTLERDPNDFLSDLFGPPSDPAVVLTALERAAIDPRVEGVVIRLRGMSIGWGRAAELRRAVTRLRDAEKKVVFHLDGGDDADVWVASAADRIYVSPAGGLAFDGLRITMVYLHDLLEQLGITVEAIAAGQYKTAPRIYTHSEPSPEELEVQNVLLDTFFKSLVDGVAEGRGLKPEEVKAIIDRGGVDAGEALEAGLIDGLAYWDELPAAIEELAGRTPNLDTDYGGDDVRRARWDMPPQIAVVPVVGEIRQGRSGGGPLDIFGGAGAGSDDIVEALERAHRDPAIKAVVLRVDSPGGGPLASDLIWHAVMKVREDKPVVASMGDVAASGGYYVAAGADEIFAEEETITGSIGVFALLFEGEQLLTDLGVNSHVLKRGEYGGLSPFTHLDEKQRAAIKHSVEGTYERFLQAIHEGRGMDTEEIRKHAEGRVWTGAQAKERGLVDTVGGLAATIERARELADITDEERPDIALLTSDEDLFPRLATAVQVASGADADKKRIQEALKLLLADPAALELLLKSERPLVISPARIVVE
jgi:protease-4